MSEEKDLLDEDLNNQIDQILSRSPLPSNDSPIGMQMWQIPQIGVSGRLPSTLDSSGL